MTLAAVVNLAAWRRQRASRLAAAVGHPSVTGGPNREHLLIVAENLVPEGYYAGLWQSGDGTVAHAVRGSYYYPGDTLGYVTRCGRDVDVLRRADTTLRPCRACFPS